MILRLIFEFHAPYKGYPLYISANAFRHMIGMSVNSSFGFFTTSPLNCPKIYEEYFFEKKVSQLLLPHFYYRRSRMGNLAKIIPIFFPKISLIILHLLNYLYAYTSGKIQLS